MVSPPPAPALLLSREPNTPASSAIETMPSFCESCLSEVGRPAAAAAAECFVVAGVIVVAVTAPSAGNTSSAALLTLARSSSRRPCPISSAFRFLPGASRGLLVPLRSLAAASRAALSSAVGVPRRPLLTPFRKKGHAARARARLVALHFRMCF